MCETTLYAFNIMLVKEKSTVRSLQSRLFCHAFYLIMLFCLNVTVIPLSSVTMLQQLMVMMMMIGDNDDGDDDGHDDNDDDDGDDDDDW